VCGRIPRSVRVTPEGGSRRYLGRSAAVDPPLDRRRVDPRRGRGFEHEFAAGPDGRVAVGWENPLEATRLGPPDPRRRERTHATPHRRNVFPPPHTIICGL